MTKVSLSLKLQTVLNYLDEIDDIFAELEVDQAMRFQEKIFQIRGMTVQEIERLDQQSLNEWNLVMVKPDGTQDAK